MSGNIMVMDWTKTQTVPFSTTRQPIILSSWFCTTTTTGGGSAVGRHPGAQYMGIHQLRILSSHTPLEEQQQNQTPRKYYGDVQLSWITSCGWAMLTILDIETGKPLKGSLRILHRPNPIRWKNHRNEYIDMGDTNNQRGWSLPSKPISMTSTHNCLCWERVPDVVQILPDHDKYVLADHPRSVIVPSVPTLHVLTNPSMGNSERQLTTVRIGKKHKTVIAVAVHHSLEWIVVSTEEDGIQFYARRQKP
jgi:hypothetical protein